MKTTGPAAEPDSAAGFCFSGDPDRILCHDDLGMAVANSLAGIENGARQVEGTINGIGERAGNAALEEVVMAICTRRDALKVATGIDTRQFYWTSRMVSEAFGMNIPHEPVDEAISQGQDRIYQFRDRRHDMHHNARMLTSLASLLGTRRLEL